MVDPYRYNRDNLTRLLAAAGYQVGTYDEGRDVLARIDEGQTAQLYVVSDTNDLTGAEELFASGRATLVVPESVGAAPDGVPS